MTDHHDQSIIQAQEQKIEELHRDRADCWDQIAVQDDAIKWLRHESRQLRYDNINLRSERDEARAEVTYWKEYALDRQREVERLTQERLDRNPETKTRVDEALGNLNQTEAVTINTDTGTPASKTIAEELIDPDSYGEDTDGQYVVFDQKRMMKIVKRVEELEEMVK